MFFNRFAARIMKVLEHVEDVFVIWLFLFWRCWGLMHVERTNVLLWTFSIWTNEVESKSQTEGVLKKHCVMIELIVLVDEDFIWLIVISKGVLLKHELSRQEFWDLIPVCDFKSFNGSPEPLLCISNIEVEVLLLLLIEREVVIVPNCKVLDRTLLAEPFVR